MMAIMEALVQIEDVEKQSAVIKGETLGEKKEENVEIKTEVKEEYVEPASLSQGLKFLIFNNLWEQREIK